MARREAGPGHDQVGLGVVTGMTAGELASGGKCKAGRAFDPLFRVVGEDRRVIVQHPRGVEGSRSASGLTDGIDQDSSLIEEAWERTLVVTRAGRELTPNPAKPTRRPAKAREARSEMNDHPRLWLPVS